MNETVWDAAVIGGGPAGCSAAISLASRGLRVIQFESRSYPHNKLCGEFLSPECAYFLEQLGMGKRLYELNPVPIHKVFLTAPDGTAWESNLPGTALGLSRRTLDAAMADQVRKSGGTLWEEETVTGVIGSLEDGFELEVSNRGQRRSVFARAVIAAHGKRGAFDQALGRQFIKKRQPFVAIKAHFHGPPIPQRIELHTFPGGYCGMSEIENGDKVVCFLVQERTFRKVLAQNAGSNLGCNPGSNQGGIDHFLDWMKNQNLYICTWMQWAKRIHERWISIAQVPFLSKPALERDILMAGDAAGLIAPLAGNGISMALDGGMLAAGYLERYLSGEISAENMRSEYPAAWEARFSGRLRLGRLLQPLLFRAHTAALVLKVINAFPPAGRFLINHTRQSGITPIEKQEEKISG